MCGMKCLIGKKIKSLAFSKDRQTLTIQTSVVRSARDRVCDGAERDYRFDTTADCCSSTWWDGIDDENNLIGGIVINAEDIPMPERPCRNCGSRHSHTGAVPFRKYESNPHDVVAYYGVKITTDRGIAVIDFRNDSNGYYGGDYELVDDFREN